ncbi:hypothetical protein [Cupriavidus sp. CP313]
MQRSNDRAGPQNVPSLSFNLVYATVFSAPLRRAPEHLIDSTTGLMNFGGQLGNSIFPAIMGALITAAGGAFFSAFYLLVGVGALSIVAALLWKAPDEELYGLAGDHLEPKHG